MKASTSVMAFREGLDGCDSFPSWKGKESGEGKGRGGIA